MSDMIPGDYTKLLAQIKERIRGAQYDALRAVNRELIALYWDIGQMIVTRRQGETWGKAVVQQLAADFCATSFTESEDSLRPTSGE